MVSATKKTPICDSKKFRTAQTFKRRLKGFKTPNAAPQH